MTGSHLKKTQDHEQTPSLIVFKTDIKITPVFESNITNTLELSKSSFHTSSEQMSEEGLWAKLPPGAALPSLVRMEFTLKKGAQISAYAKWTLEGDMHHFSFLIMNQGDRETIKRSIKARA